MKENLPKQTLRWMVVIPTSILILTIIGLVYLGGDVYVKAIKTSYFHLVKYVGWTFGPMTFLYMGILFYAMFSKIGDIRIGGDNAEKIFKPLSFFGVMVSGITGTGLIFYGATEPIYHYMNPPVHIDVAAGSNAAAVYAMGQTFMHWTFNMFAIYAVLSLACALIVYNLRANFSVSSMLRPFLGKWVEGIGGEILDMVLVLAMVLGNVYTLGQMLISVSSGAESLFDIARNGLSYFVIAAAVILVSLVSLRTGIGNAVKNVANINMVTLYLMLLFFIVVGPLTFCFALSTEGFAYYLDNIFTLTCVNGIASNNSWPSMWTIAFFGSWAGAGPVMALFLGKVGRGYTVRQYLGCIYIAGTLFYLLWFTIFGGTGIFSEMTFNDIYTIIKTKGFESGIYVLFNHYPLGMSMSILYIIVSLLSFITTITAKIDAVSSMCLRNVTAENINTPFWLKVIWGCCACFMGWACATFLGFDGVRIFAGFAGLFGMLVTFLASLSLMWVLHHVKTDLSGKTTLSPENFTEPFMEKFIKSLKD